MRLEFSVSWTPSDVVECTGILVPGVLVRADSALGLFWGSNLTSLSLVCLMELRCPPMRVWTFWLHETGTLIQTGRQGNAIPPIKEIFYRSQLTSNHQAIPERKRS